MQFELRVRLAQAVLNRVFNQRLQNRCVQMATQIVQTGDVNLSGTLTSADIIGLVNFVFKSGAPPEPCEGSGDVNCSEAVTSADIIYMVNHVFKGGLKPCDACTLVPATWDCD